MYYPHYDPYYYNRGMPSPNGAVPPHEQSILSGSAKRESESPEHFQEACEVKTENDRGEDLGFKRSQVGCHLQGAQEHLDDQAAHLR